MEGATMPKNQHEIASSRPGITSGLFRDSWTKFAVVEPQLASRSPLDLTHNPSDSAISWLRGG